MMIPSVFLGIVLFGSNEISGEIASFTSESIVGADSAPLGGNKEGGGVCLWRMLLSFSKIP